jgi:DNA-binding NarL/FixJ family response regulator
LQAWRLRVAREEVAILAVSVAPLSLPNSLTEAECGVAYALLAGQSNAEIAAARQTSVSTIVTQVSSIFRKLRVRSRAEAIVAVCRLNAGSNGHSAAGRSRKESDDVR